MLNRDPLRNQIRRAVLERVIGGHFAPGSRIKLASLADELNVSPTPAREALTQLERDGFLIVEPNRGFFVAPLTVREAHDIYPLIWTLEGLAANLQGPPSPDQVSLLREINTALEKAKDDPEEAMSLDQRWHETLTQQCPNRLVLEQIAMVKQRALRYEFAYMRAAQRILFSVEDHEEILDLTTQNRTQRVAHALEKHWKQSLAFLAEWLSTHPGA